MGLFFKYICIVCAVLLMGGAVMMSIYVIFAWLYSLGGLGPLIVVFLILAVFGTKFIMDGP